MFLMTNGSDSHNMMTGGKSAMKRMRRLIATLVCLGFTAQSQSTDCSLVTEIPSVECNALVDFYDSTNGATTWINTGGWTVGQSPCEWEGVDCRNNRVARLFQDGNGLSGRLPASLGDLTELTWLQLNGNQIGGSIPSSLGNLQRVTWLRFENNAMTGSIPSQLSTMTELTHLYLSSNELVGAVPTQVGLLSNLIRIYFSGNNLAGPCPSEIGFLVQLQSLTLDDNTFTGPLPSTLTSLSNLGYLHFLDSGLCVPDDTALLAWLDGIETVVESDTVCDGGSPRPVAAPPVDTTPATSAPAATPVAPPTPTNTDTGNLCAGLVTDLVNRPLQALAKPGYLQTVIDPSFGTTIRRITDIEATVTGERAVLKPMYNTVQAWNADESYLILYQRSLGHHLYNGQTYEFIRNLGADIFPADLEEIFWDFADPDVLYYVEPYFLSDDEPGYRLMRYSVSAQSHTELRSFVNICNDSGIEGGNDVQMMSWDSNTIGLRCTSEPALLFGYSISNDQVTPIVTSGDNNPFSPWIAPQSTPSGNLYVIDSTVLNTNMEVVRTLNQASPEHSCLGQWYDGSDGLFTVAFAEGTNGGCGPGALIGHNIEDGSCQTFVGQENGYPYPPSNTHMSALSHLNPGWIAVSSIGVANNGAVNDAGQALLDNELYLVDTRPGGNVCRIGHHRSWGRGGSMGYWAEPHVVISPSGTRILFGSDWLGSGSVDSYVVELPAYSSIPSPPINPSPVSPTPDDFTSSPVQVAPTDVPSFAPTVSISSTESVSTNLFVCICFALAAYFALSV